MKTRNVTIYGKGHRPLGTYTVHHDSSPHGYIRNRAGLTFRVRYLSVLRAWKLVND